MTRRIMKDPEAAVLMRVRGPGRAGIPGWAAVSRPVSIRMVRPALRSSQVCTATWTRLVSASQCAGASQDRFARQRAGSVPGKNSAGVSGQLSKCGSHVTETSPSSIVCIP